MDVRGRWRKKAKDMIPNKKADGRFEVCGSANCLLAYPHRRLLFPFSVTQIDPERGLQPRATPSMGKKKRWTVLSFTVSPFEAKGNERKVIIAIICVVKTHPCFGIHGPDG